MKKHSFEKETKIKKSLMSKIIMTAVIVMMTASLSGCGGSDDTHGQGESPYDKSKHLIKEETAKEDYDFTPFFGEYELVNELTHIRDIYTPIKLRIWIGGISLYFDKNDFPYRTELSVLADLGILVNNWATDAIIDEVDGEEAICSTPNGECTRDFKFYRSGSTYLLDIECNGSFVHWCEYRLKN